MDIRNKKLKELKNLIEMDRSKGGSKPRYSLEVKDLIRNLFIEGVRVSTLKGSTGITEKSIRTWIGSAAMKTKPDKFKPLSVSSQNAYELVFPNGMKVQGLSFEQLMEIAKYAAAA